MIFFFAQHTESTLLGQTPATAKVSDQLWNTAAALLRRLIIHLHLLECLSTRERIKITVDEKIKWAMRLGRSFTTLLRMGQWDVAMCCESRRGSDEASMS